MKSYYLWMDENNQLWNAVDNTHFRLTNVPMEIHWMSTQDFEWKSTHIVWVQADVGFVIHKVERFITVTYRTYDLPKLQTYIPYDKCVGCSKCDSQFEPYQVETPRYPDPRSKKKSELVCKSHCLDRKCATSKEIDKVLIQLPYEIALACSCVNKVKCIKDSEIADRYKWVTNCILGFEYYERIDVFTRLEPFIKLYYLVHNLPEDVRLNIGMNFIQAAKNTLNAVKQTYSKGTDKHYHINFILECMMDDAIMFYAYCSGEYRNYLNSRPSIYEEDQDIYGRREFGYNRVLSDRKRMLDTIEEICRDFEREYVYQEIDYTKASIPGFNYQTDIKSILYLLQCMHEDYMYMLIDAGMPSNTSEFSKLRDLVWSKYQSAEREIIGQAFIDAAYNIYSYASRKKSSLDLYFRGRLTRKAFDAIKFYDYCVKGDVDESGYGLSSADIDFLYWESNYTGEVLDKHVEIENAVEVALEHRHASSHYTSKEFLDKDIREYLDKYVQEYKDRLHCPELDMTNYGI